MSSQHQGPSLNEPQQLKAAIAHYTQQVKTQPDSAEAYVNLGNLYALQQKWQKASACYRQAIHLNPKFAGAYRNWARVLQLKGKLAQAAQKWYRALMLEPNWAKAEEHHQLGTLLHKQGKLMQASKCYRRALQLQPDFWQAYTSLAEILMAQGKPALALAAYQQVIQLNPQSTSAYLSLAAALAQQQQWQEAICACEKAIELQANDGKAYFQLGQVWQKQSRWEEASAAYYRSLELNPNEIQTYLNLGLIYFNQGEYAKAIDRYRQAIELSPNSSAIPEETFHNYYQAIKHYPEASAQDYYQLARVFRGKSQFSKALDCYQRALELDPDFKLAYLDLQYTPISSQQLEPLITFYRQIIQSHSNMALAWGNLGDVLTQQGKIARAIRCYQISTYQEAIRANPSLAEVEWKPNKELSPDFIIIGAAKCGTTSLYQYLSEHPQILLPHKKELNFFSVNFDLGVDWYLSHFPSLTDYPDFLTGEATPAYFDFPLAAQRMFELFPKVKLIILLRHPVERAISWHYHKMDTGFEKRSLESVIAREIKKLKQLKVSELIRSAHQTPNNLLGIPYRYHLQVWLSFFPREQCLILPSEDLYSNPPQVMEQVFDFLDIPHHQLSHYPICNQGSYLPIREDLRDTLADFFRPHTQKLEEYLGMKFNWDL